MILAGEINEKVKTMHEDWNKEAELLELERQENASKMGFVSWWKAPQGESFIEVMTEYPPEDSNFKDKKDVRIIVEGEEFKWTVSKRSPLYRELIKAVAQGKKKFKLIRIGEDANDTRYSLVAL